MSDDKNDSSDLKQQPDQSDEIPPAATDEVAATDSAGPAPEAAGQHRPAGSPLVAGGSQGAGGTHPAPRRGTSLVGWLALILVLGLAAAAAWVGQQALQREADLAARVAAIEVAAVESDAGGEWDEELAAAKRQWRRQLDNAVATLQEADAARQREMAVLREDLIGLGDKMASFSANDHQSWLRAEAQYLLRLANQRLIMARDVESALALLGSADAILKELDDPSLYEVRAAVAAEQAALRAVPRVDVEGIYLRLSALIEQAGQLVIFQLADVEVQPESAAVADDWQTRLERGYEEAARKLSDYVVIRRRDVPMQALMDPQWEGLVRQNLRMLLEQAQVALLSGNQTLYEESLERAQHWVAQFLESDAAAAQAMSREITQLSGQIVSTRLPDLTRSLHALDDAMRRRLQQVGEG